MQRQKTRHYICYGENARYYVNSSFHKQHQLKIKNVIVEKPLKVVILSGAKNLLPTNNEFLHGAWSRFSGVQDDKLILFQRSQNVKLKVYVKD